MGYGYVRHDLWKIQRNLFSQGEKKIKQKEKTEDGEDEETQMA